MCLVSDKLVMEGQSFGQEQCPHCRSESFPFEINVRSTWARGRMSTRVDFRRFDNLKQSKRQRAKP